MDCLPIPQFSLDFLLGSKTYLKECPPNREFPLLKDVVKLVYTHYKVQVAQLHGGLY